MSLTYFIIQAISRTVNTRNSKPRSRGLNAFILVYRQKCTYYIAKGQSHGKSQANFIQINLCCKTRHQLMDYVKQYSNKLPYYKVNVLIFIICSLLNTIDNKVDYDQKSTNDSN